MSTEETALRLEFLRFAHRVPFKRVLDHPNPREVISQLFSAGDRSLVLAETILKYDHIVNFIKKDSGDENWGIDQVNLSKDSMITVLVAFGCMYDERILAVLLPKELYDGGLLILIGHNGSKLAIDYIIAMYGNNTHMMRELMIGVINGGRIDVIEAVLVANTKMRQTFIVKILPLADPASTKKYPAVKWLIDRIGNGYDASTILPLRMLLSPDGIEWLKEVNTGRNITVIEEILKLPEVVKIVAGKEYYLNQIDEVVSLAVIGAKGIKYASPISTKATLDAIHTHGIKSNETIRHLIAHADALFVPNHVKLLMHVVDRELQYQIFSRCKENIWVSESKAIAHGNIWTTALLAISVHRYGWIKEGPVKSGPNTHNALRLIYITTPDKLPGRMSVHTSSAQLIRQLRRMRVGVTDSIMDITRVAML